MRWLIAFIIAVVGAAIAGPKGAVIGFVFGCIIAALIFRKKRDMATPPIPKMPVSKVPSVQHPSHPPPLPTASSGQERLHELMRQIETSRSADDRDLQSTNARGIGVSSSFGEEQPLSSRGGRSKSKLIWYGPGEPLIHADTLVSDGMVYTSERGLQWPGEPSAIILSLRVADVAAHPLQQFGYYPSYDKILPEQRRCYLQWLAAGRKDSDPSQRSLGYLFIFFYGLERRILLDQDRDPALIEEIIRLLQHYGPAHKSRSLRSYFLQLMHFAGWQLGSDAYRALWPRLLAFDEDRPDLEGLRFVLANLHQRGEPLEWMEACRIALADQESRRSTVVARAQEKFFALFEQRFNEQFAGGLVLEAAKQEALVQYRPASSALAQMTYESRRNNALELRIPNVAGLNRQFKALPAIWNSCVDDLSGYSRALRSTKPGQAVALAAWKALPRELRKLEDHPLKPAFNEIVANAPREGDYVFVPTAMLATLVGIAERARLTVVHSREIAEIAETLGWEIAPDPRITGLPLAWNQELAIYTMGALGKGTETVTGAVRLQYLAITLAAADGVIEPEELDTFYRLVAPQITDENGWRCVRATEASLRRDPNVALRSLPQMSKLIPAEAREFVLRLMALIAAADGEVSLDELKLLRRIARAFGLNPDSAERLLREDEAFYEVTIASAERSSTRGEAIPSRAPQAVAFSLNRERISALTQETAEVISLLSVVMAETEEAPCPPSSPPPPPPESDQVEWLRELEPRYRAAVLALLRHDEITSHDFDCLAAAHHLMPDDLFNAVNTWADNTLGDFLLERGENIRIFRNLVPDLTALPIAA
jgi:tellurite resistance protein